MNYNQFSNLSCYEEFEMRSDLTGVSKIDILKRYAPKMDNYYFFVSNDGIFNWFDLDGNYVEDPGILKELKSEHISRHITKCIIPNSVVNIGYLAFSECESLKEIIIPNSVTSIGWGAFSNCKSLKEIIIPDSIAKINSGTFSGCESLTSINIPDSVISIGDDVFWGCNSLKEIIIPNSVTSISFEVFFSCKSLKEIIIPDSVINIDFDTFFDCISLKEVIFKGKTLDEVKRMKYYPFGIKDESIIKVSKV